VIRASEFCNDTAIYLIPRLDDRHVMAWRYRKSKRLPLGFRLNASKSGLGLSWGFKGFRVTQDAKGQIVRTVSLPGTGLSQRDVLSASPHARAHTQASGARPSHRSPAPRYFGYAIVSFVGFIVAIHVGDGLFTTLCFIAFVLFGLASIGSRAGAGRENPPAA
jgi:hypothetical protein